jgi:hypothetical protein
MLITDLADCRRIWCGGQPFPAFLPDIKQASMSFKVPVQFSIR